MPLTQFRHSRLMHGIAGLLMGVIFGLDAIAPPSITVAILYIIPTILFVGGSQLAEPLVVAALATVLTIVGLYVSPDPGGLQIDLLNRVIAIAALWIAAALVVTYVRMVEKWTRETREATAAREESLRRLKDIEYALDQSAIVAATDQTGKITYVNDKFCQISKYSREELLGQDHRIINSGLHSKEFIRDLWRTIAHGRVWRGELRNRAKDGSFYWVDTTIVPFLNERGKPWQYLSIRNDITQRKMAEEQLRDEAALTQLGRLSAVVAHEVRNPLAALKGGLQVLASRLPADLPGKDIIGPMQARIDALNRTVQDILTYSKPNPPKPQRFNVASLVNEVANTARAAVPGAIINVIAEPVIIEADPEMTRAALLNLLINAAHVSGDTPIEFVARSRDGHCDIEILDRGPGIPTTVREHLFEPFITTRPGGTGLGLAIARRLTQQQGGTIRLDDRTGGGTAAIIRIPLPRI